MKNESSSYNRIIKTTTIFGGSQVLVALMGLVRNKIIAILLGPVGLGILGIYQSIIDMMRTVSMMGIDTVGIKEIAEANASSDKTTLYKVTDSFIKWVKASALLSLTLSVIFCYPISLWAFESGEYAIYIALLSVSISLLVLNLGKSSILQGLQKITEMAKISVIATLLGLLTTIPIYYFWRMDGIIPALTITSIIWLLCTEYYYRKLKIPKTEITNKDAYRMGLKTLRLGLYIVIAGFVSTLSMFAIKAFISRNIDIDAAGLFQSSWVITNVYFVLLLKALASDYFPRLSAIATDTNKMRALVNEQSYIVLILASPIIIAMLLFSDLVLSLLYTSDFVAATEILKWQLFGTFFKIIGWPISFVLLARNKGLLFLITEVVFYAVYLLSVYILYPYYGLEITGIGYFIAYIAYLVLICFIARNTSGFGWNREVLILILANLLLVSAAFMSAYYYADNITLSVSILTLSILYAYLNLRKVFSIQDMRKWISKR